MLRQPPDDASGDWQDLGRPDFVFGQGRYTRGLTLLDGQPLVIFKEYGGGTYVDDGYFMYSRHQPGRGWETAQQLLNTSANRFDFATLGTPPTVRAKDGTTYLYVHTRETSGPATQYIMHVGRWAAR